jgi:hypothetical protein
MAIMVWMLFAINAYFNFPQHDDYYNHAWIKEIGSLGVWKMYLHNHDGRWLSNAIVILFVQSNFILNHYFIAFLITQVILMGLMYISIRNILFKTGLSNKQHITITFVTHVAYMLLTPETSTAYYWLTTVIGYHFSTLLLVWYISLLFRFIIAPFSPKIFTGLLLLSICLPGLHELVWATASGIGIMVIGNQILNKQLNNKLVLIVMVTILSGLVNIYFNSVTGQAVSEYISKSIIYKTGHTLYQYIEFIIILFKQPLLWVGILAVNVLGIHYNKQQQLSIKQAILYTVALQAIVMGVIAIPHVFGMGIPYRVYNLLAFVSISILCIISFYTKSFINLSNNKTTIFFYMALIIIVIANNNIVNALQSVPTGFLYHKFYNERIAIIQNTKATKQNKAHLYTYEVAMKNYLNIKPRAVKVLFEKKIGVKPITQFYDDDLAIKERIGTFAEYFGIDSIVVNDTLCKPRFGITKDR